MLNPDDNSKINEPISDTKLVYTNTATPSQRINRECYRAVCRSIASINLKWIKKHKLAILLPFVFFLLGIFTLPFAFIDESASGPVLIAGIILFLTSLITFTISSFKFLIHGIRNKAYSNFYKAACWRIQDTGIAAKHLWRYLIITTIVVFSAILYCRSIENPYTYNAPDWSISDILSLTWWIIYIPPMYFLFYKKGKQEENAYGPVPSESSIDAFREKLLAEARQKKEVCIKPTSEEPKESPKSGTGAKETEKLVTPETDSVRDEKPSKVQKPLSGIRYIKCIAISLGSIAAAAGCALLLHIIYTRPNPLEPLYEQGKLSKTGREATSTHEAILCKQIEEYLNHEAELNSVPYIAHLFVVANEKNIKIPVDIVRNMVQLGADVNAKSQIGDKGATPWDLAIEMNDIALLDYLAEAGATKTEWTDSGCAHVVKVVQSENEALLRAMCRHGMSVDSQKTESAHTALMEAAINEDKKMVKLLIELGANVNATCKKNNGRQETVLDVALGNISNGDTRVIDILIQAGAKASIDTLNEMLFSEIEEGNEKRIKQLLAAGASLNAEQEDTAYTPLMLAIVNNKENIVRLLVAAGASADATTTNDEGQVQSALSLAQQKSSMEIRALLGDKLAIKMKNSLKGLRVVNTDEAVHMLERCEILDDCSDNDRHQKASEDFLYNYRLYKDGHKKITDYAYTLEIYECWELTSNKHLPKEAIISFIAADSDLAWHAGNWYTLDYAVHYNHIDIAKALIAYGANVNNGHPLIIAANKNNIPMLELLLENGADINATKDTDIMLHLDMYEAGNVSALMQAAKKGNLKAVEFLIAHQADINLTSKTGMTALLAAIKHPEIVKLLIKNGANVNHADKNGKTPLHYAIQARRPEVVRILLEKGADMYKKDAKGNTIGDYVAYDMTEISLLLKEFGYTPDKKSTITSAGNSTVTTDTPESRQTTQLNEDRSSLDPLIKRMRDLRCKQADSALYQKRLLALLPRIREGAEVNLTLPETNGNTALHYSCAIGSLSITKWLLEHGANPNAVTNKGKTPLQCVGSDNRGAIIQALKAHGAE